MLSWVMLFLDKIIIALGGILKVYFIKNISNLKKHYRDVN